MHHYILRLYGYRCLGEQVKTIDLSQTWMSRKDWHHFSAFSEPYVQRGCGGVACNDLPGVGGISEACDTNHKVRVITDGQLFNQSRGFSGTNGNGGTLQYCNNGNNCNSGAIADFMTPLKNFYYISRSSALLPATLVTVLSAVTLAFSILLWVVHWKIEKLLSECDKRERFCVDYGICPPLYTKVFIGCKCWLDRNWCFPFLSVDDPA